MQIFYDIVSLRRDAIYATDNIYEVISKYDNRFAHETGTAIIRVNNSFDLEFTQSGTSNLYIDGRQTTINYTSPTEFTCTIIVSTTLFYFLVKTNNAANTPVTGFCWVHEGSSDYIGVAQNYVSQGQLDSMYFSDMHSSPKNTNYTIKRHAQFTLKDQNIVFIATSVIADNGGNYKTLSEVRSCSTTTFDSTISVNHSNYYAIGYNSLVRIGG